MNDLRVITSKEGLFLFDNLNRIHLVDETFGYYGATLYKNKIYLFQYDKDETKKPSFTGRLISYTLTSTNFEDKTVEVDNLDNETHQVKVVIINGIVKIALLETYMQRIRIYTIGEDGHLLKDTEEIITPNIFVKAVHPAYHKELQFEEISDNKYYYISCFAFHNEKWYISASIIENEQKRSVIYILDTSFQLINTICPEQYNSIDDIVVTDTMIMFLNEKNEIALYNEETDQFSTINLPDLPNIDRPRQRGLSIAHNKIICCVKNYLITLDMEMRTANVLPLKDITINYITYLDYGIDLNHGKILDA